MCQALKTMISMSITLALQRISLDLIWKATQVTFSQAGVQEENVGKNFGRYLINFTEKRAKWDS